MKGYVYPRLDAQSALELLDMLRRSELVVPAFSHVSAKPNEVGAVIPEKILRDVRASVLDATAESGEHVVPAGQVAAWDRAVGRALHASMQITPADASHEGVWSFVTLVLLPDVASRRFSGLHSDRFLGGLRNTFARCWWRQQVLGDLAVPPGVKPLGEDELVGVFERSKMARDHRLARHLAEAILQYKGPDRSNYARKLFVRVRSRTGPLLLDTMDEIALADLVRTQVSLLASSRTA